MNLNKTGKLISKLRKEKGLTQKQLADIIGVVPKTISKWETGNGFPDVSLLAGLSDALGVSEKVVLEGEVVKNNADTGNLKRTKFYVCPHCASFVSGAGNAEVVCCGKPVKASVVNNIDCCHNVIVSEIENDFYIEFNHQMTKEHYINFVSYVSCDRCLVIRLYPEQNPSVRFPKMYGGKLLFYCSNHGLFEYKK